jgi:hypothetical protein
MTKLPWQTPYMMTSNSMAGGDEIEALQTDVMRFMAILGLCLMAIFSLVQNSPEKVSEKTPELESKQLLQADIAQMQENLTDLLQKIKQLDADIQQKKNTKQELKTIKHKIVIQRGQLTVLNKELQQEQQALTKIRQKLKHKQKEYQQQEEKLESITETKAPTQQKTQKKGFSLRFATDQVLLDLLMKQQVKLYIMMGSNAWKLSFQAQSWQVEQASSPKQFYQMAEQTVPTVLSKTAKKNLSVHAESKAVWAIELPYSITDSIKKLMQTQQGGGLIIGNNGEVKLK